MGAQALKEREAALLTEQALREEAEQKKDAIATLQREGSKVGAPPRLSSCPRPPAFSWSLGLPTPELLRRAWGDSLAAGGWQQAGASRGA